MTLKRFTAILVFTLAMAATATSAWFYFDFQAYRTTPARPAVKNQIFTVRPGDHLKTIARSLEAAGLVTSGRYFMILARIEKASTRIQAGEYLMSPALTPDQILSTLLKGRVKLYRLTLPEGLNITETADRVEIAGFCPDNQFEALCRDPDFIASLGLSAPSLEGYLFPDTYFFPRNTSCPSVIKTMIKRFNQVFSPEWQDRATALGLTPFEVITLASIIEKETGNAAERPLIASVFHNRLKKRMRLESDPTVIYGIQNFDGNITRRHLRTWTPYNTYQIKGLPAGPIANPGAKSIEAALFPLKTEYLFFVSKKDTTHYFSKTIQEHNRAVRKYQLRKR